MIPFAATLDLTTRVKSIRCFNVAETASAAAVVNFRNGGATGAIFQQIRIPAVAGGNSVSVAAYKKPVLFPSGLYIQVVSGTVVGSVGQG